MGATSHNTVRMRNQRHAAPGCGSLHAMSNERDGGAHAGTSSEGSTLLGLRARRIDLEVERIVAESELRAVRAGSARDIPGASAGTVVDALDRLRRLESTRAAHVALIDTGARSRRPDSPAMVPMKRRKRGCSLRCRLQIASDRPRIVGARTDNEPDNDHTNTPSTTQIGRLFHLSLFRTPTDRGTHPRRYRGGAKTWTITGAATSRSGDGVRGAEAYRRRPVRGPSGQAARHWESKRVPNRSRTARRCGMGRAISGLGRDGERSPRCPGHGIRDQGQPRHSPDFPAGFSPCMRGRQ